MGLKFLGGIFFGRSLAPALRRVTLEGFLGFRGELFNRILLLLPGVGIIFKFFAQICGARTGEILGPLFYGKRLIFYRFENNKLQVVR